jgi:hypothetical protein
VETNSIEATKPDKLVMYPDNVDVLSMPAKMDRSVIRMLENEIEDLQQMTDEEWPIRAEMIEFFTKAIEITERVYRYEHGLSDEL